MEKRTLFYWGKLYTGSIHEGDPFYGLKKTITINLLDFNYFDTKEYHTKWHIVEDTEKDKILTDVLEIHFIELKKFIKEEKKPENKKEEWLYFLDYSKRGMVEMLSKKNKVIEKANEELEYLTGDAAIKRKAELRDKWIRDYKSGMEGAEMIGIQKGEQKKKIEIIKEMLKIGVNKEIICRSTKINIKELEKIQKDAV